jgi:hypothetical protein
MMKKLYKNAAILLLVEFSLLFIPLFILGISINWPASLDEPASVNLPLILKEFPSVITGYSIYLLYSILFWPLTYLVGKVIVNGDDQNTLFQIANGFGILSTLARCIGIVRWLFAMPVLARLYVAPDTTEEMKASISIIYDMLNSFAGGIGELLGVSLFAVIWLVLISVLILRSAIWTKSLGYFGFVVAGALLINLVEVVGIDPGPMITISVVLLHIWMLVTGIVFLRKKRLLDN